MASASSDLVAALRRQVLELETDLRSRVDDEDLDVRQDGVYDSWKRDYDRASSANRTAASWQEWRNDRITQAAVAWVLLTVFARYCEDNHLVTPRWISGARAAARAGASLVAVSCSAWLVSMPLTAHFFGQICPVALLSNLVVIPVAFLVVLSGCLSIALGACIGFLADVFNHASLVFVTLLTATMNAMSQMPMATVQTGPVPAGVVVAWYAALAAITAGIRHRLRRRLPAL